MTFVSQAIRTFGGVATHAKWFIFLSTCLPTWRLTCLRGAHRSDHHRSNPLCEWALVQNGIVRTECLVMPKTVYIRGRPKSCYIHRRATASWNGLRALDCAASALAEDIESETFNAGATPKARSDDPRRTAQFLHSADITPNSGNAAIERPSVVQSTQLE